jgi:hypothetical protein
MYIIYTFIYTQYIYDFLQICTYLHKHVCICINIFQAIFIHPYMYISIYMYIHIYTYIYTYTFVYIYSPGAYIKLPRISESLDLGRMNADTPYRWYVYIFIYCIYSCICICVYIHICIYSCIYMYVFPSHIRVSGSGSDECGYPVQVTSLDICVRTGCLV